MIEKFLKGSEFADLCKYAINHIEWDVLKLFYQILQVSSRSLYNY